MPQINYPYIDQYLRDIIIEEDFIDLKRYADENKVPIMREGTKEFLKSLLLIQKPGRILELGTAIGYSALVFSKYTGAEITTIELSKEISEVARKNFDRYGGNIKLINKDASKALDDLHPGFDFVFIDANKGHYKDYFEKTSKLINNGGIIACDNVLFRGQVANDDLVVRREITIVKRLREFLAYITNLKDFQTSIIPIGDGLSISVKVD